MSPRLFPLLLSFAWPLFALVSCGADVSAPVALEGACADYAVARCALRQTCQPVESAIFGGLAACRQSFALLCTRNAAIPGTSYDAPRIEACAEELLPGGCDVLFSQNFKLGPSCDALSRGSVPDRGPCALGLQCRSGQCVVAAEGDSGCGTCSTTVAAGQPCDDLETLCGPGFYCDDNQNLCLAVGPAGAQCGGQSQACDFGLVCNNLDLCAPQLAALEPCTGQGDASIDLCDSARGLICDPDRSVCVPPKIVIHQPGESCDPTLSPEAVVCAPGSYCKTGNAPTCSPQVREGQFCEPSPGDAPCLPPATCVDGKCSLSPPDLPTCN